MKKFFYFGKKSLKIIFNIFLDIILLALFPFALFYLIIFSSKEAIREFCLFRKYNLKFKNKLLQKDSVDKMLRYCFSNSKFLSKFEMFCIEEYKNPLSFQRTKREALDLNNPSAIIYLFNEKISELTQEEKKQLAESTIKINENSLHSMNTLSFNEFFNLDYFFDEEELANYVFSLLPIIALKQLLKNIDNINQTSIKIRAIELGLSLGLIRVIFNNYIYFIENDPEAVWIIGKQVMLNFKVTKQEIKLFKNLSEDMKMINYNKPWKKILIGYEAQRLLKRTQKQTKES